MKRPTGDGAPSPRRRSSYRKGIALLVLALVIVASFGTMSMAQPSGCTNLIADSGLETGSGWSITSGGSYAMISNYLAHGGAQSAHLAGVDNANDQLKVALTLLADKPTVTLSFWWRIHTEEESNEFDGLSVVVADAAGNALRSLLTLGSNSAANQWQQQTLDLSEYAGQSIQLQFVAQTDASLITDFFVDDVAVTACGASQTFRVLLPITQR